ncbi:MAG: M13 family metallopeptidase [Rudaea sp.]|nr:M13 family metallopeptidase [Rudaea sp.]
MPRRAPEPACETAATAIEPVRFDVGELNHQISPREDLDAFVNSRWRDASCIPAGYSWWDCFSVLGERSLLAQADIARGCARSGDAASVEQRIVGDFWATGMDAAENGKRGLQVMRSQLHAIDTVETPEQVSAFVRECHARGSDILFRLQVRPDFADPSTMMAYILPQGLGLPDRDFYFDDSPAGKAALSAYASHVAVMLKLSGLEHAGCARLAADVVEFERRLAGASIAGKAFARDISKMYNPISPADADRGSSGFSWSAYFAALQACTKRFSLANPQFHALLGVLLLESPAATWRAYLRFHLMEQAAPYLSDEIAGAHEHFHGLTLRGRQSPEPRWKRVLGALNTHAGDVMGKLYTARYRRQDDFARMHELMDGLRAAMRSRIERLDWMSAPTKRSALRKLDGLTAKVGCPPQWRDWSGLATTRHSWYENIMAARAFNRNWLLAALDKPADLDAWSMTPQTVNARYDPQRNEIVLPAAILQPPFFDPAADAALNHGGIGAVIAHEMIHGYDDQGSRFGPDGRFEDWWTSADRSRFEARAAQMVECFNKCVDVDGGRVDGELTLGENIADCGGLALACEALQRSLAARAGPDPMCDGFSQLQRFFLNWAVLWRQKTTPDERRLRLKTDPHAPGNVRVNIAAGGVASYAEVFGCRSDDAMLRHRGDCAGLW